MIPQAYLRLVAQKQAALHEMQVEMSRHTLDIMQRLNSGATISDGEFTFDWETMLVRTARGKAVNA